MYDTYLLTYLLTYSANVIMYVRGPLMWYAAKNALLDNNPAVGHNSTGLGLGLGLRPVHTPHVTFDARQHCN